MEIHPGEFTDGVGHWEDVQFDDDSEANWSGVPSVPSTGIVTTTNPPPAATTNTKQPFSVIVKDGVFEGISFVVRYALEILSQTLRYLINPLSFLLFLLFLWILLWFAYDFFSPALHKIHSSICLLPGMSWFTMCHHWKSDTHMTASGQALQSRSTMRTESMHHELTVDYHQVQGSIFENLLDHASATSGEEVSLGMWKVEMDTENMLAYVLKSGLEKRDDLAQLMEKFAANVEVTASNLADLNSKSMGAVD